MARGFRFFEVERMPTLKRGKPFQIPNQLAVFLEIEVPDTTVGLIQESWHLGFAKLTIHHEILERTFGRAKGTTFNEFVKPFDLPAFYNPKDKLLLIQGKKEVVVDFSRVVSEKTSDIQLRPMKVDLIKIKPLLDSIYGTWFKMNAAHLRSAGLFGDHVDQSPQYREAEKAGDPGAVYINYEFKETLFMTQITSEGAVVNYQNMEPELELEFLMEIKRTLLDFGKPT